ncbi:MAG: hypothetical protein RIQ89_439 [Bacteroidota bacterium]
MEELLRILTFILISSVKFSVGLPLVYLNDNYNFTFFETNMYAIIGGMIGVIVFMHFSEWLLTLWRSVKKLFIRDHTTIQNDEYTDVNTTADHPVKINYLNTDPKKKIFTKRNRRIVSIWRKYGLVGLAALTPILFSIPLGVFVMTRLEKNKKKILFFMFISIVCWSLVITIIFELMNKRNINELIN